MSDASDQSASESGDFSSSGSGSSDDSFADGKASNKDGDKNNESDSESQSTADEESSSSSDSDSDNQFQQSTDATADKMESKITTVSNAHHDEAMELSMSQSTVATDVNNDGAAPANAGTDHKALENQPYDEAVELSSSSDDAETPAAAKSNVASNNITPANKKKVESGSSSGSSSSDDSSDDSVPVKKPNMGKNKPLKLVKKDSSDDSGSDSDSDSSGSSNDKPGGAKRKSYDNLRVSAEIQEMFQYIKHYEPPQMELDTKLKCFIPDYIPSIGNIDPFIKVARPDDKPDELGLTVLDEPHSQQSDSTVLEMQLRAVTKKSNLKEMAVACIENAEKDTGRISRWIENIEELHRSKPSHGVAYTEAMPDVESLMQVWPPEFEEKLRTLKVPPAELDVSLDEYAQIACNLLDIPMHKSAVQSLHVFFTLFSEFTSNQHFVTGGREAAKAAMAAIDDESKNRTANNGNSSENNVWRAGDSDMQADSKHDDDSKSGQDEGKDNN